MEAVLWSIFIKVEIQKILSFISLEVEPVPVLTRLQPSSLATRGVKGSLDHPINGLIPIQELKLVFFQQIQLKVLLQIGLKL